MLQHAPVITDIPLEAPSNSLEELADSLRSFVRREKDYRLQFQQSNYRTAFDGYSWPGQQDSLNQGPEDQLHSFVFSDFSPVQSYPLELQPYCLEHWPAISTHVHQLEKILLIDLGLEGIAAQHALNFGHMMSANYFPPLSQTLSQPQAQSSSDDCALRLSEHPDVSLLTVFPFGIGRDFQYQDARGHWCDAPKSNTPVIFAGDLLRWMSDGAIPALNHRVRRSTDSSNERFSFALFSLPKPGTLLHSQAGESISVEDYYLEHLSQWDY